MSPRTFVALIASVLILTSATVIATYIAKFGFAQIGPQSVRFALTCALGTSLIRGWVPGRWIAVVLLCLAGIGAILLGAKLQIAGNPATTLLALAAVYLACALGLLTPLASRHFNKAAQ